MTDLQKPVKRRALNSHSHTGRNLIIEIRPGATETVYIREQGRRNGYAVPIEAVYKLAARLHAEAVRSAKKNARKDKAQKGQVKKGR
jgi:hypothetical protein